MFFRFFTPMFLAAAASAGLGPTTLWNSFESSSDLAKITTSNVTVAQTSQGVTDGKSALLVNFGVAAYPNIRFVQAQPLDWHTFIGMAMDVFNPGSEDLILSARIDDDVAANGSSPHTFSGQTTVFAQSSATVVFYFNAPSAMAMGMKMAARAPGSATMANSTTQTGINPAHITAFELYLTHPTAKYELIFDNLRLLSSDAQTLLYTGIVDAYGQFANETWPGKVASDADITQQLQTDASLGPPPAGWDEYGGLATGANLPATGFFRTWQEPGGTWWLVTPSGHLFFSVGVDAVRSDGGSTFVEGREFMFNSLPAATDPLATYFGTQTAAAGAPGGLTRNYDQGLYFNFYRANLQRKYGPKNAAVWREWALTRLHAWGFNTLGDWCDTGLFTAADSRNLRMAYTEGGTSGSGFAHVATSADYWGTMPDPYDPKFATAVDSSLESQLTTGRNDPYLIGYFVDNELSWAGGQNSSVDSNHFSLAYGVVNTTSTSPAKQAWVQTLTAQYGAINALNQAWGTSFASFTDLLSNPYTAPATITSAAMRSDFSAFLKAYAEQYFKTVAGVIHKYDPNHLYLGVKFSEYALETVEACAEYCDAISFDAYQKQVDPTAFAFLNGIGKPAITAEFHFGSLDRGSFGAGLVPEPTEQARGQAYATYVQSVASNPNFVGAHWFEYSDEPLTGRLGDGENYASIGLVADTDAPYPELTAAARTANEQVYTTRQGGVQPARGRRRP